MVFRFFALSGYFMAMIVLSKQPKTSFWDSTGDFYYRRIYRVLPLYLFNLLITTLIIPVTFITFHRSSFISDIKAALSFTINISMWLQKRSYFNPYYGIQWFKHYWSLCLEIQFYLIVPFIFFLG